MDILVTGEKERWDAFRESRGTGSHRVLYEPELRPLKGGADLVIDLSLDERPENLMIYSLQPGLPVLGCLVKTPPAAWEQYPSLYAANWLPGFYRMPRLEVGISARGDAGQLKSVMQELGWEYETVKASAGLVTPRTVAMIINEAYFTAEEGTASREDIDISMKLGTNYPLGPFEWCSRIGIRNVYEVLRAVYAETGNERYRICETLEKEYNAFIQQSD
ncbi:3-hydroxyacyl-CoA dehydrogenase family protein [Chitinophaga pollutisoli]|uniref:3-hydroxyacyl-CoA dehydrogenase family protein n=1 Tax=Chitinophaga pollutisoli TaxID=3133966 RepID=A0ABZ2YHI6_9BACT